VRASVFYVVLLGLSAFVAAGDGGYNPLEISGEEIEYVDLTVADADRDREIPIRVYLPAARTPVPVVFFSHGLGGSRSGSAYLGRHWAARGYVAVFLQHPGSDEAVWKGVPPTRRMKAMEAAAGVENFRLRAEDVPAVLDMLERWNLAARHPLAGRLNLEAVGMSGHSFGALTTQAVSGQTFWRGVVNFTDSRIDAAIAFSPSSPRRGDPESAFAVVRIPWLLMTGTEDVAPIGDADVGTRLAVFKALPVGGKYELVLRGAEHSAFTDRALPGDEQPRNPNHHRAILAISTAFWDAYLQNDAAAHTWLDGDGPRSVLEEGDRWQRK
jgi:predicted dienelactone hydrolase